MSLKKNIIYLYFKGKHLITSKSQYQYNHGQYLYFADLNLPQAFEVHFSNKQRGESKTQIGSNKLVEIPDEYFWSGALEIYAWVYLHSGTDDGETIYEVKIPLIKRAKPTDEEPLPVQQSAIDKAIAELNNAVDITNENADKTNADKTQVASIKEEVITLKGKIDSTASTVSQDAQSARESADASEQSAQNSAEFENNAHNYADEAKGYAQSALESKNTASQKAQVASDASAEAKDFRDEAENFKNEAEQAKQNIVDYRNETKGYRDEALTAKNDVQTIKGDVQSLKTQIDKTATDVATNALDAKSSADSSYQSAISADNASLSASQFADEASDFADSANLSANQAEEFKNQSATNVTHYPKVVDGYWYVWDASKNEYVNTNVDARGVKGDKGDVGISIENTVLNSDYTLTITFTDGTSYTTPSIRGEKGIKGDVGNGIASTVLNDDYTLTITFTDGTTYKTPSIRGEKGEKGEPATDMDIHICSASEYDAETRIPTIANPNDKTFYLVPTEDGTSPDLFTEWVYVNGAWEIFGSASVDLTDYVKNTDYATNAKAGVIKLNPNYGINITDDGILYVNTAESKNAKMGTNNARPITPIIQHESTFYGLAKAAGADEKDSTLAFGTYSDNAKSSIQNMLGITDKYSPKEWVAESETELVTNAHNIGDLFYIGETLYKVIANLNAGDAINVGVNVEEVNVNDILDDYATKEDVENNVSIVEKNASGAVASFDDGMDNMPLKSLTIDINPVQDLNGYDSPWVGGGGANKWDEQWELGSLNSNTGLPVDSTTLIRSKDFCECSPSTEYAKVCSPTSYVNVFWYDENQAFISLSGGGGSNPYSVITSPSNAKYFKIRTESAYGTTYNHDIAINYPSSVTTYSPYENICPISGWTGANVMRDGRNLWGGNITEHPSGKRVSGYGATGGYPKLNKCINPNTYTISVICNLPSGETPEDWAKSYNIRTWFKSAIDGKWYEFPEGNYSELRLSTSVGSKLFTYTTPPNISVTPTEFVSKPFELTIPVSCIALGFYKNGKYLEYTSIQLEVGNTASDIEAYKGNSIPINWQSEAGTVYGGKLDVLSGKLRVEWAYIDLASLSGWVNNMGGQNAIEIRCTLTGKKGGRTNIISNLLKTGTETSATDSAVFSVRGYPTTSVIAVKVPKTVAQDSSEVVTWIANNHPVACYELAEPIEIQLDAHTLNSLYRQNNIFADTGDSSVTYFSQVDEDLVDYIKANLNLYAKKDLLNDYVDDVQINGTSIVEDGVANVPIASYSKLGVVKTDADWGIGMYDPAWSGGEYGDFLYISPASSAQIKAGYTSYKAIVPNTQHKAVFYGLAKASGDTTQSTSSNAVGTYTDEAKSAILDMLGISDIIGSNEGILASKDYSTGDLFLYKGKLYKATASIAKDATIAPNTNCIQTTLIEFLKNL